MDCKFIASALLLTTIYNLVCLQDAAASPRQPAKQAVSYARVRGWEASLVQGSPNLAQFYWEPMTRRIINTTGSTGHQANHAPLPVVVHQAEMRKSHSKALSALPQKLCDRMPSESASKNTSALIYGDPLPSEASAVDCSLRLAGVSANLVNSATSAKLVSRHALAAHQLSFADVCKK